MSDTRFDKIQKAFFSDPEEAAKQLSPKEMELKRRYETGFTYWVNNPHLDIQQVVRFLRNEFGLSKSVAYEDVRRVKLMLGDVKMASKEWYRHLVIDMCLKASVIAKEDRDSKAMIMAADKIGKYTKLDKDEVDPIPYERLIPPNFEPDPDVSILNLKPIDNIEEKRKKLREKYHKKYRSDFVEDAVIVDPDE